MTARGSGSKTPHRYQPEPFGAPASLQSAALARKGDLELRLQRTRERVGANPSLSALVNLYVDMIAVIDRHLQANSDRPDDE